MLYNQELGLFKVTAQNAKITTITLSKTNEIAFKSWVVGREPYKWVHIYEYTGHDDIAIKMLTPKYNELKSESVKVDVGDRFFRSDKFNVLPKTELIYYNTKVLKFFELFRPAVMHSLFAQSTDCTKTRTMLDEINTGYIQDLIKLYNNIVTDGDAESLIDYVENYLLVKFDTGCGFNQRASTCIELFQKMGMSDMVQVLTIKLERNMKAEELLRQIESNKKALEQLAIEDAA
jgi:hypothetical protein